MLVDFDVDQFADKLAASVERVIAPLQARIAALETARAATTGVEYRGVFADGVTYGAGHLVTRSGGLWLALKETQATPGSDPGSWKLIVKEGLAR